MIISKKKINHHNITR